MANPNNVLKYSDRKMILVSTEVRGTIEEAEELKTKFLTSGQADIVRVKSFKTGAKPSKYNGFKQQYSYSINAYKKATK